MKDFLWFILKDNLILNIWIKYFSDFDSPNEKKFKDFIKYAEKIEIYGVQNNSKFTDKNIIKNNYHDLTNGYVWPSSKGYTSGTTNSPLKLRRSVPSIIYDEACLKKHWYQQGVPLMPKVATLRGDVIPNDLIQKNIFWFEMKLTRRLLMSSFHLSNVNMLYYLNKLDVFKPDIILAYPSAIISFAKFAKGKGWKPHSKFIGVFTSGEFFSVADQKIVKEVFGSVFDHYGQAERVARLQQCSVGNYHIKHGYSIVDFEKVDDKYEIIGTAYLNKAMPIINYRTGDFIAELPSNIRCTCGLASNYVTAIEGRESGVLISPSGKEIPFAGLSRIVYGLNDLAELQYRKINNNQLNVLYTTLSGSSSKRLENELLNSICSMLGDEFEISFKYTPQIPRNKSGKLSAVICE